MALVQPLIDGAIDSKRKMVAKLTTDPHCEWQVAPGRGRPRSDTDAARGTRITGASFVEERGALAGLGASRTAAGRLEQPYAGRGGSCKMKPMGWAWAALDLLGVVRSTPCRQGRGGWGDTLQRVHVLDEVGDGIADVVVGPPGDLQLVDGRTKHVIVLPDHTVVPCNLLHIL